MQNDDAVSRAIRTFRNKIKSMIKCHKKFEFLPVLPENLKASVNSRDPTKGTSGDIPIQVIKETIDLIYVPLTECLNSSPFHVSRKEKPLKEISHPLAVHFQIIHQTL